MEAKEAKERVFTIPLKKVKRAPRGSRAPLAIGLVRKFLFRHLGGTRVLLGKELNDAIWAKSIQKPPPRLRVLARREGETIRAELEGFELPKPKPKAKKKARCSQKSERDLSG